MLLPLLGREPGSRPSGLGASAEVVLPSWEPPHPAPATGCSVGSEGTRVSVKAASGGDRRLRHSTQGLLHPRGARKPWCPGVGGGPLPATGVLFLSSPGTLQDPVWAARRQAPHSSRLLPAPCPPSPGRFLVPRQELWRASGPVGRSQALTHVCPSSTARLSVSRAW